MQINILKRVDWLIALALLAVIIGGGLAWRRFSTSPQVPKRGEVKWMEFKDSANSLSFEYLSSWKVSSSNKFVSIETALGDPKDITALIKIDQDQMFVDAFGLNDPAVAKIKLGTNEWAITHHEYDLPPNTPNYPGKVSYTHLYLRGASHTYMIEISPWQKDGFSADLERAISSFKQM